MIAGDPLPLLRILFSGPAAQLFDIEALAARLRGQLSWRWAHLDDLAPPLPPGPEDQFDPPDPQRALAGGLCGQPTFLITLQAGQGELVWEAKATHLEMSARGLRAGASRAGPPWHVFSLDAAVLHDGFMYVLETGPGAAGLFSGLLSAMRPPTVAGGPGDLQDTLGQGPDSFMGASFAMDSAAGVLYLMDDEDKVHALRLEDRTWLPLPDIRWLPGSSFPLAMRAHGGKLFGLHLTRPGDALPGVEADPDSKEQQLQVWVVEPLASAADDSSPSPTWRMVEGSCKDLPRCAIDHDYTAFVGFAQGIEWLVWMEPVPAAAQAGAEPLALTYDPDRNRWRGPHFPSPAVCSDIVLGAEAPPAGSTANPRVAGSAYFSDFLGMGGLLAPAAAVAAAAMQQHEVQEEEQREEQLRQAGAAHLGGTGAAAALVQLERQQRHPVALLLDDHQRLVALWQEQEDLPPTRLGELATPEGLLYDLRLAQAVRAMAASEGSGSSGSGGGGGSCGVLLRLAADPSLRPVACPLAAAHQCGELVRLLEVMGEQEGEADMGASSAPAAAAAAHNGSSGSAAARELTLVGVGAEEHAALRQLVRCLAGKTHAGLLEATLLLDVARLADLLDAPALLAECLAALECMTPGAELFVPLLALAEARQYHGTLQRLQLFYRHALAVHILQGAEPLLRWALRGLQAGVDTVLEVCKEVAVMWLPHEAGLWLGSPQGDLIALLEPAWQAAVQQQPGQVQPLLEAVLAHAQRLLSSMQQPGGVMGIGSGVSSSGDSGGGQRKKARVAGPGGPFQSAAVRPPPGSAPKQPQSAAELAQVLQRVLQHLGREMPRLQAMQRQQRTAQAFAQAEAGAWA